MRAQSRRRRAPPHTCELGCSAAHWTLAACSSWTFGGGQSDLGSSQTCEAALVALGGGVWQVDLQVRKGLGGMDGSRREM